MPGQRLFDKMIDGDLIAGAVAFASEVGGSRRAALPLVRHLKVSPEPDAFCSSRATRSRR